MPSAEVARRDSDVVSPSRPDIIAENSRGLAECCRWSSFAAACSARLPSRCLSQLRRRPGRRRDAADALLQHAIEAHEGRRRPSNCGTPNSSSLVDAQAAQGRDGVGALRQRRRRMDGLDRKDPKPGAQGRKARARGRVRRRSSSASSMRCSPATCATSAHRSTDADSSSRCSRRSPLKRASSSCVPRPAGGGISLRSGARRHPGAVGVGVREFNPLCANVFLYWHMVREAIERRFRTATDGSTPGEGTFQESSGARSRASWSGNTGPPRGGPCRS